MAICAAAIVDGAMSHYGGIIGVGKVNGPDFFDGANKNMRVRGIEVNKGSLLTDGTKGIFSYYTFKIDNVDFSKKNIRILNNKGEIDYQGRVEIRTDGQWGTLSETDSKKSYAQVAC